MKELRSISAIVCFYLLSLLAKINENIMISNLMATENRPLERKNRKKKDVEGCRKSMYSIERKLEYLQ